MPLQNRVLPTGEIVAHPARGAMMGNRGILHDVERRLGAARWRHKAWIACLTDFRGRRRAVMAPGRYTELFFHDEAVSLAAGHRPCAECRRPAFEAFRLAWSTASGGAVPRAAEIDRALHAARVVPGTRQQRTLGMALGDAPDGAFVRIGAMPHLVWDGAVWPFAPGGYGAPMAPDRRLSVTVLTPVPTLGALRGGYRPTVSLPGPAAG